MASVWGAGVWGAAVWGAGVWGALVQVADPTAPPLRALFTPYSATASIAVATAALEVPAPCTAVWQGVPALATID